MERAWDDLRTCAPSTKEMGPGARFDTIDDQMGGHNWRKVTGTGSCSSFLGDDDVD